MSPELLSGMIERWRRAGDGQVLDILPEMMRGRGKRDITGEVNITGEVKRDITK
jgi:hypothetical protein